MEHLFAGVISIMLVIGTTMMHYEILRITWIILPRLGLNERQRIIPVILSIFFAHSLAIWAYGCTYWFLDRFMNIGRLKGAEQHDFITYIYFSAEAYTSLGLGDIVPTKGFYLLVGVESLNGLVLIGWSVAFTFLVLQRFWDMHPK